MIHGHLFGIPGGVRHAEDLEFGVDLVLAPGGLHWSFRLDVGDFLAPLEHGLLPLLAGRLVVTSKFLVRLQPKHHGLPGRLTWLLAE